MQYSDLSWLENIVINNLCLVDTSTLMSEGAEVFFYKVMAPILVRNNKKLILPKVVIDELENNRRKPDRRLNAEKGLKILDELYKYKLIDVRGEQTDTHPDQVFRRIYAQYGTSKDLLFITNDIKLSEEICNMCNSESVKTRHKLVIVKVLQNGLPKKICEDGKILQDSMYRRFHESGKPKQVYGQKKKRLEAVEASLSSISLDLNKLMNEDIKVTKYPTEGDELYLSSGEPIILAKRIAVGGEGSIYETNRAGVLAKIYAKEKLTRYREYKVQKMIELGIKKSIYFAIAWPTDIVKTVDGKFVGFIMDEVKGKKLQELVFTPANAKRHGLSRKHLVSISLNLLKAFRYLHMKGIIIGDINPQNIFVDHTQNNFISIIDTDSFQFGAFKCEVGTPEFTRPSLLRQNVNFKDYTRNAMDEAFAITVMIFRILMLGKHPFSYKGGDDIIENMKKGNFPYKLKTVETSVEDVPIGPWRYIWSHIMPSLRESLGKVILEEIEIKNINDLVDYESKLIKLLEFYREKIQKGISTDELVPYYHYVSDNIPKVKVVCSSCGYKFEMAEEYYKNLIMKRRRILCGKCLQVYFLKKSSIVFSQQDNTYAKASKSYTYTSKSYTYTKNTSQESLLMKILRFLFFFRN